MDTEFCRGLTSLIQIWFYEHDSDTFYEPSATVIIFQKHRSAKGEETYEIPN